ncbi:AzlC family ABC transporter permease, partial [Enterococcus faecalis]|uniref:AzlC family ABC transporter permease n=1 Tax=Enterococcus faecalis TaxID=1351 RepID=UPI000990AE77
MKKEYSTGYITFKEGVKACIPTILGYFGIAAGILGKSSGLSIMSIVLMSAIIYGGSSQFIIIGMLATNSPFSAIIFTTFLVNARHFLMSLSVSEYFRDFSLGKSIGIGALLTDESYGVLMNPIMNGKQVSAQWVNGLNITAYLVWILSTLVGALIGNLIPDPNQFGLDFALVAMFVGLIVLQIDDQLKSNKRNTLLIILSVGFCCKVLNLL